MLRTANFFIETVEEPGQPSGGRAAATGIVINGEVDEIGAVGYTDGEVPTLTR